MSLAEDLLAVLDDPTYMWSHALRESSLDSQRLFLTLPLLPQPISADDLQIAYSTQEFSQAEPFLDSLRALEDSFISINAGYEDRRWVRFRNPSLQDFSYEYLNRYSDWLDRLLSKPVYYEQLASVYNLAMSRLPGLRALSADSQSNLIYHEGALRFSGIRAWVAARHDNLITKAINLALSASHVQVRYSYETQDLSAKLKELLDAISMFGEPSAQPTKQSLARLIDEALKPTNGSSAITMLDLLRLQGAADIVRQYYGDNAIETLRTNILDKDTWKFPILLLIDRSLEIDPQESMITWGDHYVAYLDEFVEEMSYSQDYEDLSNAIGELERVSSFLRVDLHNAISALESQRDGLPSEEEEEDYESYSTESRRSSSSRELDKVFASLLN